jgi:hypothetical protein
LTIEKIDLSNLSRDQWLALRKQDVTASAIAPLLGVDDGFGSAYSLWALKTGLITEDIEESGPMLRGRLLEPVALKLAQEQNPTWKIWDPRLYLRDPTIRLGCTPDAFVDHPDLGRGIIQIKSVEGSIFRKKWRDDETREIQPPIWIAVQAITEAHLAGAAFAKVAALVVGFGVDLHIIDVPIHPGVVARVRKASVDFWDMVASGKHPPFDWKKDADLLAELYAEDNATSIDLTGNNMVRGLAAEYAELSKQEKAAKDRKQEIKAEMLATMGEAAIGMIDDRVFVTMKTVHKREGFVRATSYRNLKFTKGADE